MSAERRWRPSWPIMVMAIVLVATLAWVVGVTLTADRDVVSSISDQTIAASPRLPWEDAPMGAALAPRLTPSAGKRHLADYYARRAYPGAPPYIPHAVADEMSLGGGDCNSCHQLGGYTAQYEAYVPVTPHPQWPNCRQCHAAQRAPAGPSDNAFTGTTWVAMSGPPLGRSALGGSPPVIPHSLQLRENCVACHAGSGAVQEIQSTHPERGNCRQCHVPATVTSLWSRP